MFQELIDSLFLFNGVLLGDSSFACCRKVYSTSFPDRLPYGDLAAGGDSEWNHANRKGGDFAECCKSVSVGFLR